MFWWVFFFQTTDDGTDGDKDGTAVSSSKTITSETTTGTTVTTTTTHISKVSGMNVVVLGFSVLLDLILHASQICLTNFTGSEKRILRGPCGEENRHNRRL